MEKYPVLRSIFSWPMVIGFVIGSLTIIFLVYPPAVGWGSDEKWGDVPAWFGVAFSAIASFVTLWAVLVSIRTSREQINAAFKIREMEVEEQQKKSNSLRLSLSVIFRHEIILLGSVYHGYKCRLREAYASADGDRLRELIVNGSPRDVGLPLMEKFASDFHTFPDDTAGKLAMALFRWTSFANSPNDAGKIGEAGMLKAAANVIAMLEGAVRDLRIAHAALLPFIPPTEPVSDWERRFSDLERDLNK